MQPNQQLTIENIQHYDVVILESRESLLEVVILSQGSESGEIRLLGSESYHVEDCHTDW